MYKLLNNFLLSIPELRRFILALFPRRDILRYLGFILSHILNSYMMLLKECREKNKIFFSQTRYGRSATNSCPSFNDYYAINISAI